MARAGPVFSARSAGRAAALSSFVSLGNATQPFPRLLDAIRAAEALLPRPLLVQHGATPPETLVSLAGTSLVPFVDMVRFEAEILSARLLLLHAGAGSVLHAVRAGKRPIVMARRQHLGEHIDDHQLEFARTLAASGHVLLAETAEDLPQAIAHALADPAGAVTHGQDSLMVRLVSDTLAGYAASLPSRSEPA